MRSGAEVTDLLTQGVVGQEAASSLDAPSHGYFGPGTPQTVKIARFLKIIWLPAYFSPSKLRILKNHGERPRAERSCYLTLSFPINIYSHVIAKTSFDAADSKPPEVCPFSV